MVSEPEPFAILFADMRGFTPAAVKEVVARS